MQWHARLVSCEWSICRLVDLVISVFIPSILFRRPGPFCFSKMNYCKFRKQTWVFSTKLSALLRIRASTRELQIHNSELTFWMSKSVAKAAPVRHPYLTCQGLSQLDYWMTMCSPTNLQVCLQPMWLFGVISNHRIQFYQKCKGYWTMGKLKKKKQENVWRTCLESSESTAGMLRVCCMLGEDMRLNQRTPAETITELGVSLFV